VVRASKRLLGGTELHNSYVPLFAPVGERNETLSRYRFTCQCPRCLVEKKVATNASGVASNFRAELKKLSATVCGVQSFTLGGTFAEMLEKLRVRVAAAEVAAVLLMPQISAQGFLATGEASPKSRSGLDELCVLWTAGSAQAAGELSAARADAAATVQLLGGPVVEAYEAGTVEGEAALGGARGAAREDSEESLEGDEGGFEEVSLVPAVLEGGHKDQGILLVALAQLVDPSSARVRWSTSRQCLHLTASLVL